jgi:general secretion pathway protein M
MNQYLQQAMTQWMQLRPRERVGLTAATIVLAMTMVYLMLWEPVFNESEQLKRAIQQNQQLVSWMEEKSVEAKALVASSGPARGNTKGASLLGVIDSTAKRGKLGKAMKRVEPDGSNRVRVWMEEAAFDDLIRWLARLENKHGIKISSVVIDKDDARNGHVSARLVFTGGAS